MRALREGDTVRVVRLEEPATRYLMVANSPRAPRLGDKGLVIDVRRTDEGATTYAVECDDGDGEIVWLALFGDEEIELESDFERGL